MSDQYIEFNLMDMQMDESGKQYIPADKWKDISNEYTVGPNERYYEWTRKTSPIKSLLAGYHTFYPGITGSISLYVGNQPPYYEYGKTEDKPTKCTCDIVVLLSVGCKCGGV